MAAVESSAAPSGALPIFGSTTQPKAQATEADEEQILGQEEDDEIREEEQRHHSALARQERERQRKVKEAARAKAAGEVASDLKKKSGTSFSRRHPHSERRQKILKNHPEIKKLQGKSLDSAIYSGVLVVIQFFLAILIASLTPSYHQTSFRSFLTRSLFPSSASASYALVPSTSCPPLLSEASENTGNCSAPSLLYSPDSSEALTEEGPLSLPTLLFLIAGLAYVVGAVIDHALWVLIHEFTHNLVFQRRLLNRVGSVFSNLPHVIPTAITFGYYHRLHHIELNQLPPEGEAQSEAPEELLEGEEEEESNRGAQGDGEELERQQREFLRAMALRAKKNDAIGDPDVPTRLEADIVRNHSLRKALWLSFFWLIQALRLTVLPTQKKKEKEKTVSLLSATSTLSAFEREEREVALWIFINYVSGLSADLLVLVFLGWPSALYLLLSSLFAIGLHPLGARWIQEHYPNRNQMEGRYHNQGEQISGQGNKQQKTDVKNPQESNESPVGVRQPTYSYYGNLNTVAFNIGFHNEHHDFPTIPWSRLPQVKKTAPEYYESLFYYTSYSRLLWEFIWSSEWDLRDRRKVEEEEQEELWKEETIKAVPVVGA